jgi:hypothetical protein
VNFSSYPELKVFLWEITVPEVTEEITANTKFNIGRRRLRVKNWERQMNQVSRRRGNLIVIFGKQQDEIIICKSRFILTIN